MVLTGELPGEKLATGDVDPVVQVNRDGKAFEVEFVALDGETVAIVTLRAALQESILGFAIAAKYGADNIRIFGSVPRGEDSEINFLAHSVNAISRTPGPRTGARRKER